MLSRRALTGCLFGALSALAFGRAHPFESKLHARLFEAMQLGSLQLPNRIIMAPMTRGRAGMRRTANPLMAEYYSQRASAGLIVTEGTAISPQGYGWKGSPAIYTAAHVAGWKGVVDAVHRRGGRIFLQLWHTGRVSHPDFQDGEVPIGLSAIAAAGRTHTPTGVKPYVLPRAMTRAVPADRIGVRLSPTGAYNDMRDADPAATFTQAAKLLNRFGLAYLHVIEPVAQTASSQSQLRIAPHMRAVFDRPLIINEGYDAATGAAALGAGEADMVAYGRHFLANPDLVARFRSRAALNRPDATTFYTEGPKGYTDYLPLAESLRGQVLPMSSETRHR